MKPLEGDRALLSKLEFATPLGGLPVEFVSRQQQRLIDGGFVEFRAGRLFLLAAGREWLREVENG